MIEESRRQHRWQSVAKSKLVEEQASTTTEEKRSGGNEALHKVGGRYTFIDKSVTEPTGQRKQSRGNGRYGKWYTMERKLRASIIRWITGRKKTAVECPWSSVSGTSLTHAVRAFNVLASTKATRHTRKQTEWVAMRKVNKVALTPTKAVAEAKAEFT